MTVMTATGVEGALRAIATAAHRAEVARFFFDGLGPTQVMGVPIGRVFPVAKVHCDLPLAEIERLLDSPFYEARMAAVAVMDFQARQRKAVSPLSALYELYMRRHDRIDNWDLVDRAAPHVVGQYLADRSRAPLREMARSPDPWRRRTAVVATWWFIRAGDVEDTFTICELLADDRHPMIAKAMGSWLRAAGDRDAALLTAFLQAYRMRLPAETVRMAIEKWPAAARAELSRER